MTTILLVDDDRDLREIIADILTDEGFSMLLAEDGAQALQMLREHSPQVVLLDIRLPDIDGIDLLQQIKTIAPDVIVIMLTAYADIKEAVHAMKIGAYDYIAKPFDTEEFVLIIRKALQTHHLTEEVKVLREELARAVGSERQLLGDSPQIQFLLKQVHMIAPTAMTVILQGESGTGKELAARLIHQESPRKDEPFVPIDCGAIPDNLVESELFGYEKGAFTGAETQKPGKFEQAEGGTLFLDEIANLPLTSQAKLLRVIQERTLHRIGGTQHIPINVRMIAATNKPLHSLVSQGAFRRDLFHRLNEFSLILPPLRDRQDDILLLSKYFLEQANLEFARQAKCFSAEAVKLMLAYPWRGNVRELKNEVRRAVLISDSELIRPEYFSFFPLENSPDKRTLTLDGFEGSFDNILAEVQRALLKKALTQANGNKVKAAQILQITRKRLYRKMEQLGM